MKYFPYDSIRPIQTELVEDISNSINCRRNVIVHAPTGLGKTVSSLVPAIELAIEKNLKIFFLTSRHTQHNIVIKTLQEIKKKHDLDLQAVDLIGKRWLCPVSDVDKLPTNDFNNYCKSVREEGKCEYYNNTRQRNKPTFEASLMLDDMKNHIYEVDQTVAKCEADKLCTYEVLVEAAKTANVIIADYYYIYNDTIRDNFFSKTSTSLDKSIIIVDEAHNLPQRLRELSSQKLSTFVINKGITEATKYGFHEVANKIANLKNIYEELSKGCKNEKSIGKDDLRIRIEKFSEYNQFVEELITIGDSVREISKQSFIGSIGGFLKVWIGTDNGFVRVLKVDYNRKDKIVEIYYNCLDPSLISKKINNEAYSTIMMSGTLTPTSMYKDILGFDSLTFTKEYESPFPQENRMNLIIPRTTTKFSTRSEEQFQKIGQVCVEISEAVKGNVAIFFPSYFIRDKVYEQIFDKTSKTIFREDASLSSQDRKILLQKFKNYKNIGAVLLGVSGGSFSEGVDFPGDILNGVVVIGVPLSQPNLVTKALIDYYDMRFKKGWDYGYIFPALNKVFQAAGRCIRSETDKGIIAFVDERYMWSSYKKTFPPEWHTKVSLDYERHIKLFFDNI